MAYTLDEVDEAEALVRSLRPQTLTTRDDYDWSLAIRDKDSTVAIILFQCGDDQGRPEITTTPEEIRDICFMMGSQWTPEQMFQMLAARG